MAQKLSAIALGFIIAASPLSATTPKPIPETLPATETPGTQYCLRVGPYTGSRLEAVQCWTRQEWADQCDDWDTQCVDVDKEWAKNGVRIEMKE
ncbi:hypothetical protein LVY65_08465 [Sphingomonas sp. G124]|uniref:Uncharacterized protein n=1 Tax=Sphingomonas cremea TaxID=2904799 RepID=A0A9X1TYF5_9SPHN|nr:hypothetical protein [Sphingomonas cremea]MCF2515093.1 hypothetical protein [Sphingomonas cremea]